MSEMFDPDNTVIKGGRVSVRVSEGAGTGGEQDDMFALPVGTRIGDFEITKLIGIGGFGIVYLALDHSLDRNVALKEYMPSSVASRGTGFSVSVRSERHIDVFSAGLRSFINEAHLLAHFDHPSLVKVHRFWETGGTAFMVMPYYDGPTLKQALRQSDARPSEAWLRALLRPLLDALQVLHRENCFHRDISPDNIILLKSGQPVLLDFGAARRVIGDMTKNLTVIVKSGYAPIEQYADDLEVPQGPWTDIYAIGALAYFAIMGRAPTPSISRVMNDPVVPLEQAAKGQYQAVFLRAIDRALQVNPNHRPQSVEELLGLLGWSDNTHLSTAPVGQAKIPTSGNRTKGLPVKAIAGAIAFATLLLVAGTMWFLFRDQPGPTAVQSPRLPSSAAPAVLTESTGPPIITELKEVEQPQEARPLGLIPGGASSSPVLPDTAPGDVPAGASSPLRMPIGSREGASAKAPAATANRPSELPAPAKREPAPAPAIRPPAPVEPPAAPAVAKRPPGPTESPAAVPPLDSANTPGGIGISPKNACVNSFFSWICMKEMCSQPEFRSHKECVDWRAPQSPASTR